MLLDKYLIYKDIIFKLKAALPTILILSILGSCSKGTEVYEPAQPVTDSILVVASNKLNSGQLNGAVHFLDSSFSKLNIPGPVDYWNKYYFKSKIYLLYDNDPEKTLAYLDSMFSVIGEKNKVYKSEYALTKFLEGDHLKSQNRFTEAFQSYFDGRNFAQENMDACQISNLTYQLGLFRYGQNQYQEAIPYLKQAFIENQECAQTGDLEQNLKLPQMYLNTLALCYEKIEVLDSAAYYYQEALEFLETARNNFPSQEYFIEMAKGVVYGNLGGVRSKTGHFSEAEKLLLRSIQLNDRTGYDRRDAQTAKIKLIDLYIQQSKMDKANLLLKQLEEELPNSEVKNVAYATNLMRWHKVQWQFFDKMGDIPNAYYHLKRFRGMNDSLESASSHSHFVDIETAFTNREQQYELSLMASRNKINNIYLKVIIVFTLLAIVFLVVARYNLKRSKNINKVISQNNIDLQETLGALEQSQAENTKIMSIVAHDLRNPISSILMMADILLEDDKVEGENRMLLEHIVTSCNNSLNLVSEMMQSNRSSAGLKKEPVEIDRLLGYCVELLLHKAKEKNQQLILDSNPVTAKISREKMWRVISNLIANAIKFSPKGSEIRIGMENSNGKLLITVKDQGIGIPEHIKDQVFEFYTDGKREGTEGEQPFGMGLAISKQIISAHNGKIWFDSTEDEGTTFFVEIPTHI